MNLRQWGMAGVVSLGLAGVVGCEDPAPAETPPEAAAAGADAAAAPAGDKKAAYAKKAEEEITSDNADAAADALGKEIEADLGGE